MLNTLVCFSAAIFFWKPEYRRPGHPVKAAKHCDTPLPILGRTLTARVHTSADVALWAALSPRRAQELLISKFLLLFCLLHNSQVFLLCITYKLLAFFLSQSFLFFSFFLSFSSLCFTKKVALKSSATPFSNSVVTTISTRALVLFPHHPLGSCKPPNPCVLKPNRFNHFSLLSIHIYIYIYIYMYIYALIAASP